MEEKQNKTQKARKMHPSFPLLPAMPLLNHHDDAFWTVSRGHLRRNNEKSKSIFSVFFVPFIIIPSPCTKLTQIFGRFDLDMLWLVCHILLINDQTCCVNIWH